MTNHERGPNSPVEVSLGRKEGRVKEPEGTQGGENGTHSHGRPLFTFSPPLFEVEFRREAIQIGKVYCNANKDV